MCFFPLPPSTYDSILHLKGLSRKVYRFLGDDAMIIHNKYIKWRDEIGEFCDGICDYAKQHLEIYRVTNVPKYRSCQYRILQRGLVTNIQLSKWGMRESELCSFCKSEPETTSHLLADCPIVRELWNKVEKHIYLEYGLLNLNTSTEAIILNRLVGYKSVVNFICLLTKQFIY